jgi:diguanylate cyclase (GGDEF)-like protein/PAS domain S-box-containing protein
MPAALPPPDETERLEFLRLLKLLDTAPEPIFDQVTRLTSRLLGVPTALFSLVDVDRQWFKSRVGMDVQETPRDQAFCGHAILQTAPLVVPDASADARFSDNPLVAGQPKIRFYAGVPIRSRDGLALGTLCAIDSKPRELTTDQLETLRDLADIIKREIQYREGMALARENDENAVEILAGSEARFRSVFDLSSIGMAMLAPDGGWLAVNNALCQITGYTSDELERMTFSDLSYAPDLEDDLAFMAQLRTGEITQFELEKRYIKKDGELIWVNLNVTKKTTPSGELSYYIAAIKDIQAQKEAEGGLRALSAELESRVDARTKELNDAIGMLKSTMSLQQMAEQLVKDREAELRSVIENANDAYISLDQAGIVREWNRQAELTFGWTGAEATGRVLDELIFPRDSDQGVARYLAAGNVTALGKRVELPVVRKDGSSLTVELRITALEVKGHTIFSAFLHDISERKKIEAQREYETRHDVLTGLLNRRALIEMLPIAQARATRSGKALALLFIDLDGFKAINDSFGHDAGDTLLREIARRMPQAVRITDSVFRLAGDEFTVLLEEMTDTQHDAHAVAQKLIDRVSAPIDLDGASASVGASIGIAFYTPGQSMSAEDLLKQADHWMYEAKKAGRGRVFPPRE